MEGHKLTDRQGRVMRGPGRTLAPPQIVELYDELLAQTGSPVVAVNRAVAISRLEGPLSGLASLDAIEHAPALGLARSSPEQRWLTSRLSLLV